MKRKAMTANELRIGNYIADIWTPNGLFKVTELRKDKIFYGNCFKAKYDDIRPIPLTEEILLKVGFKKDVNGILWFQITPDRHFELIHSQGYYYPQLAQGSEMSCDNISVVSLNRIESVHQFQNLFFALTGEDIKIEL